MLQLSPYKLKLLLALMLLCILAVEQGFDYRARFEVSPKRTPPAPVAVASIDETLGQYDFERYRNVIDDNIFAVNVIIEEKPPEPKVQATKPKAKPFEQQLAITGIAITPERRIVMLWDKVRNESQVLLLGESLYQWEVVKVERKKVVLQSDSGERYEYELKEDAPLDAVNQNR